MNNASIEFNTQLELDVLLHGLAEVTADYVDRFDRYKLDEVVIPDGIKTIGRWAFSGCTGLTSVTIGNSVTNIDELAFYWCKGLTTVILGQSVASIGGAAFKYCEDLKSLTIPASVKNIGMDSFFGCIRLKSLTFDGKTINKVKAMRSYPWGYPWDLSSRKISVQVS